VHRVKDSLQPITEGDGRRLAQTGFAVPVEGARSRGNRSRALGAVLIIETDEAYKAVIETCVRLADCRAEAAPNPQLALRKLQSHTFDAVIWGVSQEGDGWPEVAAQLRTRAAPRLLLLADQFEAAQAAYEGIADRVLPKPFIPSALVGALRAATRRSPSLMMHLASRIEIKGMTFDSQERSLELNGEQISFTTQEWDLLAVFLSHPNRFLSAAEIIRLGWRAGDHELEQLRTYVRRLRLKLEPLDVACRLISQHNRGYCLIVD
jgi:DNA-binding response OmpR family regulator